MAVWSVQVFLSHLNFRSGKFVSERFGSTARRKFFLDARCDEFGKFWESAFGRNFHFTFDERARVGDEFFVRQKTVLAQPVARDEMLDVCNVAKRLDHYIQLEKVNQRR